MWQLQHRQAPVTVPSYSYPCPLSLSQIPLLFLATRYQTLSVPSGLDQIWRNGVPCIKPDLFPAIPQPRHQHNARLKCSLICTEAFRLAVVCQ